MCGSVGCVACDLTVTEGVWQGKADVNQANKNGFSPLFIACQKGHLQVVQWLVAEVRLLWGRVGRRPGRLMRGRSGHAAGLRWEVCGGWRA